MMVSLTVRPNMSHVLAFRGLVFTSFIVNFDHNFRVLCPAYCNTVKIFEQEVFMGVFAGLF